MYTFLLLSFFLWFVPYNAARFSSETLAGRIFLIGLAGFLLNRDHKPANYLLAGVILGLSFIVRYQVAFMIIGFGAWLIFMQKTGLRNLLAFTLGFLLLTAIGIIIDRWFYGEWVLTAWNYFRQNLVLGKAAGFGTSPWWYYFSETFMNAIPPFSLVYILAVSLYACFFPRDILTWSAMPFVIAHFIIPHKEIRFLFPIIGFLPVMIVRVAAQVKQRTGEVQVNKRWVQLLVNLFWITNMAMLVLLIFRPADDRISLYKKLWYDYPGPSKLYFMGENPYHRAKVDVHYYKRKSLVFVPTDSLNQITLSKDTISLLVTDNPEPPGSSSFQPVLIYSSLPSWVKKFNVNHWIERTSFWYVYELKSIPDKPVYH